jgi:UDPglucose 6-dehydrogenase
MEKQIKQLGKPESDSEVVNPEPKVLLIGYGWVGQYCGKYFKTADIYTKGGFQKKEYNHYDLAIISVPTPMNVDTGQCNTSIVEDMVQKFKGVVDYFLIKSTVEIGTTDRLKEKYGVKIAQSPEYIGETLGHPLLEPRRDAFQIIGGDEETTTTIAGFWITVLHANAPILLCTAKEAEIIKYCENYWITQRVDYWNDVYEICETLGANFIRVREGLVLDPRFSRTHSNIYLKNRGWGGKCLPKDMNALAYKMRQRGNPLTTLEQMIDKNMNKWRKKNIK